MKVNHVFTVRASYFTMGSKIEAYWFRGTVVGVNMHDFTQLIRVTSVLKQGAGRCVSSIQRIPFGIGQEIENEIGVSQSWESADSCAIRSGGSNTSSSDAQGSNQPQSESG